MLLVVGHVVKPHGIRGEVLVAVRTDEPEQRFVAGAVFATEVPRGRGRGAVPAPARGAVTSPGTPAAAATGPGASATVGTGRGSSAAATGSGSPAEAEPGTLYRVPDALTLDSIRWHQGRAIATFAGVDDRDVAEALRGVLLCVDSADIAPPSDPDEFHDHQLLGLRVETVAGDVIGTVQRIDHAPASDLLVLNRGGGATALVPFLRQFVPTVDVPAGRIVVDLPQGLLDL